MKSAPSSASPFATITDPHVAGKRLAKDRHHVLFGAFSAVFLGAPERQMNEVGTVVCEPFRDDHRSARRREAPCERSAPRALRGVFGCFSRSARATDE